MLAQPQAEGSPVRSLATPRLLPAGSLTSANTNSCVSINAPQAVGDQLDYRRFYHTGCSKREGRAGPVRSLCRLSAPLLLLVGSLTSMHPDLCEHHCHSLQAVLYQLDHVRLQHNAGPLKVGQQACCALCQGISCCLQACLYLCHSTVEEQHAMTQLSHSIGQGQVRPVNSPALALRPSESRQSIL